MDWELQKTLSKGASNDPYREMATIYENHDIIENS